MKPWGKHLILDCAGCDFFLINDTTNIREFIKELVKRIGMIAHGRPQIEFLLPGTDNEGYSVLQMITTSNITIHFVNKTKEAYIDVFSCKDFDTIIVEETVKEYFEPTLIQSTILNRQA
jgi:S-adenosylmethionine/arginine decarboxylase-like enzyme